MGIQVNKISLQKKIPNRQIVSHEKPTPESERDWMHPSAVDLLMQIKRTFASSSAVTSLHHWLDYQVICTGLHWECFHLTIIELTDKTDSTMVSLGFVLLSNKLLDCIMPVSSPIARSFCLAESDYAELTKSNFPFIVGYAPVSFTIWSNLIQLCLLAEAKQRSLWNQHPT